MRKPDSLRKWLTASLPEYKTHPDRMQIYIDAGRIAARRSGTPSFSYRYTVKIGLWDYAGDADRIIIPLLAWIEREQPQLLRREDQEPFAFEAELLDSETSDILISLDLTENVLVIPSEDASGYHIDHPPEPALPAIFPGVSARLWQGFGNADLLAETADPAAVLTPAIPPDA